MRSWFESLVRAASADELVRRPARPGWADGENPTPAGKKKQNSKVPEERRATFGVVRRLPLHENAIRLKLKTLEFRLIGAFSLRNYH